MVIDYTCNWFHNSISYALLESILYSIPLPFFIQSLIFKKWWRMPTKIIFNFTKMHSYLVLVCCYFSENNFWIYMRHLSLLQVFEIHKLFAKWWCQKVAVIKQEILLPSCYTKSTYKHILCTFKLMFGTCHLVKITVASLVNCRKCLTNCNWI